MPITINNADIQATESALQFYTERNALTDQRAVDILRAQENKIITKNNLPNTRTNHNFIRQILMQNILV